MKDQSDTNANGNVITRLCLFLCALLTISSLDTGCKTSGRQEQSEGSPSAFDPQRVAKLSHEAYKIAWDANFWARHDIRFASFQPTAVEWDTVYYLGQIILKAPWVGRDIEKHPLTPYSSSRRSNDFLSYDTMMLKKRYQPASFRSSTDVKIEKLIHVLDEIASCYEASGTK